MRRIAVSQLERPMPTPQTEADRRGSAYERVQELAGVGIWSHEISTGRFRTNDAARALIEWPAHRPPPAGPDLTATVHPDDRHLVADHMAHTRATGEGYTLDHRLLLSGGRVRYMHAVVTADVDDSGRVVAVHGVTLDVTDLRLAREEAEAQRNLSRWILSSLTEGYLLVRDDEIVEVNEALCRITGFSAAELVGARPPYPYWPVDQTENLLALRQTVLATGSVSREITIEHRSGHRLRIAMNATTMTTGDASSLLLVLLRDVTEDREREQRLRATAASDPLTGVANSGTFRRALRDQVAAHTRRSDPLSLALIDVDHFKRVNDQHGHDVGDEVLIAVVGLLRASTLDAGVLYRVGGEEFGLLLPADGVTATAVLQRALAAVRATPLPHVGIITASAGIAELTPGMDAAALFRLADSRLYEAKAAGRDQVCAQSRA